MLLVFYVGLIVGVLVFLVFVVVYGIYVVIRYVIKKGMCSYIVGFVWEYYYLWFMFVMKNFKVYERVIFLCWFLIGWNNKFFEI